MVRALHRLLGISVLGCVSACAPPAPSPLAERGLGDGAGATGDADLDGDAATTGTAGDAASPGDAQSPLAGWSAAPTYLTTEPLCAIPDDYVETGGDPAFPPCAIEVANDGRFDPSIPPLALRVVSWNVAFGEDMAAVVAALTGDPRLSGADVILLQEASRFSARSGDPTLDMPRHLAGLLGYNFAFVVSFDRRLLDAGEEGVAILSRYPLGELFQLRHTPTFDWHGEKQLYGGRVSLGATLRVGDRRVRIYSNHFDTRYTAADRASQGAEVRADANRSGRPARVVTGGDWNTWNCNALLSNCIAAPAAEQVVQDFLADGWRHGTGDFAGHTQLGAGLSAQRLDWLLVRGFEIMPGAALYDIGGSDHYPIFTELAMEDD